MICHSGRAQWLSAVAEHSGEHIALAQCLSKVVEHSDRAQWLRTVIAYNG